MGFILWIHIHFAPLPHFAFPFVKKGFQLFWCLLAITANQEKSFFTICIISVLGNGNKIELNIPITENCMASPPLQRGF